jgi:hypothetical protein
VEELLDTMSATELADWAAYYAVEPWGSEAAFLRTGIVTALIANTNRDSKRKPEPFVPSDFIPDFTGKKRRDRLDPKNVRNLLKASFPKRIKKKHADEVVSTGSGGDTEEPAASGPESIDGWKRRSTDSGGESNSS